MIGLNNGYRSNWKGGSNRMQRAEIGSRKSFRSIESDPIDVELQRQFSAHLKTSPMQWIRTRRIECKKASMAQTMEAQLHTPTPMQLMLKTN
jgi:hypothetical protein